MFETIIEFGDPGGFYPKHDIITDNVQYFVYKKIPFVAISIDEQQEQLRDPDETEIFYGMIALMRLNFYFVPNSLHRFGFIKISSEKEISSREIILITQKIIDGKLKPPILYSSHLKGSALKRKKEIEEIRSQKIYIDFFHSDMPLEKLLEISHSLYMFSEKTLNRSIFEKYRKLFKNSSRYLRIAIYYFLKADSLVYQNFPEESGINLNLVLEAIVQDFMLLHKINDKLVAIKRLVQEINLSSEQIDFLEELKDSRNEFLAHIDKDMFTERENINDPDRYCYEHLDLVASFLIKYAEYKKA